MPKLRRLPCNAVCPLWAHGLKLKEETQVLSQGLCCPGMSMVQDLNFSWGVEDTVSPLLSSPHPTPPQPLSAASPHPCIGHQPQTKVWIHPVLACQGNESVKWLYLQNMGEGLLTATWAHPHPNSCITEPSHPCMDATSHHSIPEVTLTFYIL